MRLLFLLLMVPLVASCASRPSVIPEDLPEVPISSDAPVLFSRSLPSAVSLRYTVVAPQRSTSFEQVVVSRIPNVKISIYSPGYVQVIAQMVTDSRSGLYCSMQERMCRKFDVPFDVFSIVGSSSGLLLSDDLLLGLMLGFIPKSPQLEQAAVYELPLRSRKYVSYRLGSLRIDSEYYAHNVCGDTLVRAQVYDEEDYYLDWSYVYDFEAPGETDDCTDLLPRDIKLASEYRAHDISLVLKLRDYEFTQQTLPKSFFSQEPPRGFALESD